MYNTDVMIRQRQMRKVSCSGQAPQWDYISPSPALEAKGLTAGELDEIIGNINEQAHRDVNDNYNPLYSKLMFLPVFGLLLGFMLSVTCSEIWANSDTFGLHSGFIAGMVVFGISLCGQVGACLVVGRKHSNAVLIAIDTMTEYVEITLNEQWQKQGVRWTVMTQQTVSVSNHDFDGDSVRADPQVSVQTWYNIEVRVFDVQK